MIKVNFIRGSIVREATINGRVVTLLTPELNYQPLEIDLDKLDINNPKFAGMKDLIRELSNLESEKDILDDLKKDFVKSGWSVM